MSATQPEKHAVGGATARARARSTKPDALSLSRNLVRIENAAYAVEEARSQLRDMDSALSLMLAHSDPKYAGVRRVARGSLERVGDQVGYLRDELEELLRVDLEDVILNAQTRSKN